MRTLGCLTGLLLVAALVGLMLWAFRDDLTRRWAGRAPPAEVSPAAAASAEAKLDRLRNQGDTVHLSQIELSSLVQYRIADQFPELLRDPAVEMEGDAVRVGALFPTERLPELRELGRMRAFMPDTTRVEVAGRLLQMEPGRGAVEVAEVTVAGVPIPSRFYPDVLERLGRREEPGLPPNAIAFGLPEGVGSARVERGVLVLTP